MIIQFKSYISSESFKETQLSFLLLLPVLFYYLSYFFHHTADLGFGFLSGDMPSYMANARQHFDENGFHLFYANPFNPDNSGPHIYFQLHTLLLGVIWKISGIDPGTIFMLFGFVCTFFTIRLSLKLFKSYLGQLEPGIRRSRIRLVTPPLSLMELKRFPIPALF